MLRGPLRHRGGLGAALLQQPPPSDFRRSVALSLSALQRTELKSCSCCPNPKPLNPKPLIPCWSAEVFNRPSLQRGEPEAKAC